MRIVVLVGATAMCGVMFNVPIHAQDGLESLRSIDEIIDRGVEGDNRLILDVLTEAPVEELLAISEQLIRENAANDTIVPLVRITFYYPDEAGTDAMPRYRFERSILNFAEIRERRGLRN